MESVFMFSKTQSSGIGYVIAYDIFMWFMYDPSSAETQIWLYGICHKNSSSIKGYGMLSHVSWNTVEKALYKYLLLL